MMTARRIVPAFAAVAVFAAAAALLLPATSRGANPMLFGTVSSDSQMIITLTDANGVPVTQLDPGTYDIKVTDNGTIHNFDLFGPGVKMKTSVEGTGTTIWSNVTFVNGKYTYQCDVHFNVMRHTFIVGKAAPPPPKPKVLKGSVGPGHAISLKKGSATVKSLKAGKYTVKVRDRSAKLNFHLKGPGVSKKTGVSFKGTKTWKLRLKAGKYSYKSDAGKHLKKSFTVH
jgi:hypothetical protein